MNEIVHVRSISLDGNKVTNSGIIMREVTFKVGDYMSEEKITEELQLTRSNIINTNLFLEVDITHVVDSSLSVDFTIVVKERWYWSILPHLTLADRSFNEWWYERGRDIRRTTYGVDVRHFNFTGNADQLTVKVHSGFVPLYQLSFYRPYIDKKKRFGITAGVYFTSQRNLAYRTWNDKLEFVRSDHTNFSRYGASLDFRYRKKHNYFHTFHVGFSNSSITDTIVRANPEYFGDFSKKLTLFSLSYEYRIDYRDVRQYPLRGNLFIGGINQYFAIGGMNQTNFVARYNHYFDLSNKWFLEVGVRGKASFPKEQSYFLVSGLGYGGNFARGYELYVIDGQYFLLNKNTIKYKAFQRKFNIDWIIKKREFSTIPITVYPNLFLDIGYVKNFYPFRSNSFLSNNQLIGGGAGLDAVTFYNINLKAYYSVNQLWEKKLFVAFSREF